MNSLSPVVVKVGGSLLTRPDLAERLQYVMQLFSGRKVLLIVGGGATVDEIRRVDRLCDFGPGRAHWDAIDAMTINSKLLSRVLGFVPVVRNRQEALSAWQRDSAAILDCSVFLREFRGEFSQLLPESWDVTSDSIAVSVALDWKLDQILFCKSCRPISQGLADVCDAGQLDPYMPKLLPTLRHANVQVDWIDLCADDSAIQPLQGERGTSVH